MTTSPIYIDASDPQLAKRAGPAPLTTEPSLDLAHPHQQLTRVFGPRDHFELEVVWQLVITSYRYALGHAATEGRGES